MQAMEEDDLALLDRWCAGDSTAGNELFRRYFEALYRFFEHKTDGEIDDLVQETFLACMRSRESFRRQSTFRTYLFAIARHTLFGYWRRRASKPEALDFDEISVESLSTSPSTRVAKQQDRAALLVALRSLLLRCTPQGRARCRSVGSAGGDPGEQPVRPANRRPPRLHRSRRRRCHVGGWRLTPLPAGVRDSASQRLRSPRGADQNSASSGLGTGGARRAARSRQYRVSRCWKCQTLAIRRWAARVSRSGGGSGVAS